MLIYIVTKLVHVYVVARFKGEEFAKRAEAITSAITSALYLPEYACVMTRVLTHSLVWIVCPFFYGT